MNDGWVWGKKYKDLADFTTLKDKILARKLEKSLILEAKRFFGKASSLLEIGCGTGYLLDSVRMTIGRDDISYEGVDLSASAIETAREHFSGLNFSCADVSEFLRSHPGSYDAILSQRCVQNILEEQDEVFGLPNGALRPGGAVIMCEATNQGLNALNAERGKLGLEPIESVWHNKFLDVEGLVEATGHLFDWSVKECCSSCMFVTRVLYPCFESEPYITSRSTNTRTRCRN